MKLEKCPVVLEDPVCGMCVHFRQHYVPLYGDLYTPISCGHCVYPRLKHRKKDAPACVHYIAAKTSASPEE